MKKIFTLIIAFMAVALPSLVQASDDIPQSYTDIESISNRYISEIFSAMELEEPQKDNLTSSICLLTSSVEYWNVFDQY